MSRRWHNLYIGAMRAAAIVSDDKSSAKAAIGLLQKPVQIGAGVDSANC